MGTVFVDSIISVGTFTLTLNDNSLPIGIYFLTLKNHAGNICTRKIIKNTGSGIVQFKNPADLKVFPNPTSSTISVTTSQEFDKLKVFSLDGKLVKEQSGKQTTLSVTELPNGQYTLTGFSKGTLVFNSKICVTK